MVRAKRERRLMLRYALVVVGFLVILGVAVAVKMLLG
ncbi:hypothetical protein Uis4E_0177 [Bifidobacterium parmae]|uniref:Uncharacterized protein n=1 Tax=Bifidobacterium parmae TaxID=361854 RepID=A0A2N5J6K3_9BIFI|nr:hypothetical protein Uis4E_0177 [Bifidobacterium parmae]